MEVYKTSSRAERLLNSPQLTLKQKFQSRSRFSVLKQVNTETFQGVTFQKVPFDRPTKLLDIKVSAFKNPKSPEKKKIKRRRNLSVETPQKRSGEFLPLCIE